MSATSSAASVVGIGTVWRSSGGPGMRPRFGTDRWVPARWAGADRPAAAVRGEGARRPRPGVGPRVGTLRRAGTTAPAGRERAAAGTRWEREGARRARRPARPRACGEPDPRRGADAPCVAALRRCGLGAPRARDPRCAGAPAGRGRGDRGLRRRRALRMGRPGARLPAQAVGPPRSDGWSRRVLATAPLTGAERPRRGTHRRRPAAERAPRRVGAGPGPVRAGHARLHQRRRQARRPRGQGREGTLSRDGCSRPVGSSRCPTSSSPAS